MKRWLLYGLLFALTVLIPVDGTDVGKLQPVQAVSIGYDNQQVVMKTDTGEVGRGDTPELALENLKQTASAVIYLDTADYLLVEESAMNLISSMGKFLKSNVGLCQIAPEVDIAKAAEYLRVHSDLPKLKRWNTDKTLPVLQMENERIILSENLQKNS